MLTIWSVLVLATSVVSHVHAAQAADQPTSVSLFRNWKFRTGDDPKWSDVAFDDSKWDRIAVAKSWEENGFTDYDGFAWYRLRFTVPTALKDHPDVVRFKKLSVSLGAIDDVDETWLNGTKIGQTGSHSDPVDLQWNKERFYQVDSDLIRWGKENVLAVRVYDDARAGGMIRGNYRLAIPDWRDHLKVKLEPKSPNGIFAKGQPLSIKANLKNSTNKKLTGHVSWIVRSDENEILKKEDPASMEIGANGNVIINYAFTPPGPGFYQFELLIDNGEESVKRSARHFLGSDPENISSPLTKAADFETFWADSQAQLKAIDPQFKMIYQPKRSTGDCDLYLVEMRSLGNVLVRGWYEVPKNTQGKIPAILRVPGYSSAMHPIDRFDDMAVLSFNIRGHGNSQDDVPGKPADFWIRGLDEKQGYYYQGAYMDCMRAVDFLASRPEVDIKRIAVTGGSQGGGLAFATAALDQRISYCVPEVPFMCDWVKYFKASHWPEVDKWIAKKPQRSWATTLRTMGYFDTMNLASKIRCPVLMGVGGQDKVCPAATCFGTYNQITSKKDYRIYPFATHSFRVPFTELGYQRIREHFGLKP